MYTQCPECSVSFRVTAEILKQAAGKVRCGGCGSAFNALEHLSETRPAAPVQREAESPLPELKPEAPAELEADTPPESISAAQSAALLKTLDELAGSDIRIEDTGVEWRVLDDDDEEEPEATEEPDPEPELIADTGSLKFIITDEESEEPAAKSAIENMRFDDNTPLPEDFDLESPPTGVEPPPVQETKPVEPIEEIEVDLELSDPDEWQDLLGEMDEPEAKTEAEDEAEDVSLDDVILLSETTGKESGGEDETEEPPDVDTQFALQALEMGIDTSGAHETLDEDSSIDDDLIAAAFESEAAAKAEAEAKVSEEEPGFETGEEEPEIETGEEEPADIGDIEIEFEFDDQVEEPVDKEIGKEAYSEASLVEELDDIDEIKLDDEVVDEIIEDNPDFDIPEMSEEEKTINMLIDQDLLSVAVEDEDGFASTIVQVQPDKSVDKEISANKEVAKDVDELELSLEAGGGDSDTDDETEESAAEDDMPPIDSEGFETIIMEGEFVQGRHDAERNEKNRRLGDAMKAKRANEERKKRDSANRPTIGMVAGLAGLGLLLILQVMHQSREALATIPAFNDAVGPVYRMLGKPVTPAWDVTGWTVEATTGSTDEGDELLTIYTRVANKSEKALPYPLVHVSLTDRFEEIVGSRVLEPAQYLASDLDPRDPVAAGNTFNAIIAIESPSPDATGYKISVCYRLASSQLRCAIEDFL
jgi:predicted Zn finger-like uncharacterized protein